MQRHLLAFSPQRIKARVILKTEADLQRKQTKCQMRRRRARLFDSHDAPERDRIQAGHTQRACMSCADKGVLWWDRQTAGAEGGTWESWFIKFPRPPAHAVLFVNSSVRCSHVLRCTGKSLASEDTRGRVQKRAPLWQESRQSRTGASSFAKFNLLLQVALIEVVLVRVIPGR